MKKERWKYLSKRFLLLYIYITGILLCLLVWSTARVIEAGIYRPGIFVFYVLFAGGLFAFGQFLYKPYKETKKVMNLFAEGYLLDDLFSLRYPLSPEMEQASRKFREILNTKELINVTKKQAEYMALQNQINPHFLYNTLEGIRSEALYAEIESVAKMAEALATFFRYTISNLDNLVTLEDELKNVENYYIIQQYRFGAKLDLQVEIDEEEEMELLKCQLPKLTLQPIIENAIYHGIERKIDKGTITLNIVLTKDRLLITISDDGLGMEQSQVDQLNKKLQAASVEYMESSEKQGGIAVVNVNNRIKLLFGDHYGIRFYSKLNSGTDVEITLPVLKG